MGTSDRSAAHAGASVIGLVGLGYVGLPLAAAFVRAGHQVIGIDTDETKIRKLNAGISYIPDVNGSVVGQAVEAGMLRGATDFAALAVADAIVVCVPTPLTEERTPDLSHLIDACERIRPHLKPGQLIVVESSTFPGTTTGIVRPILEQGGLSAGQDFHLAYSPERIDPGNKQYALHQVPKLVSGVTAACRAKASELYGQVFDRIVPVPTPEIAETAKLLENSFRLVNIAFINELALVCDRLKVDIWEVIAAASTKPYGFMPFYPGPGIGGHCIPVDPLYLQWKAKEAGLESSFIELSGRINASMPAYVAAEVRRLLAPGTTLSGARILVYGVTYKRDVADLRESSALELIRLLVEEGADVRFCDPFVASLRLASGLTLTAVEPTAEAIAEADCVIVHTDHSVMPAERIAACAKLVYDTRHAIGGRGTAAQVVKLGGGSA